jgi:YD repeat-containing protein
MATPTPVAQGAADAATPSNSASGDFALTGSYGFFSPRFLVSPPGDGVHSPLESSSSFGPSFDFFALSMLQAGGAKIVFSSNRDGNAQVYLMNVDGSGQIRLTNDSGNDDSPRWSPNGTKILFQSDRDNPSTGYNDIYVMNSDGTGQTRLTTDPNDDSSASWSPDGSRVVFQSIRNGLFYQVYVMNADGTGQLNLSNSTGSDGQPSWSPDGTRVAFASERDHEGFASIYVMNSNGTSQTRLTFSADDVSDEQPVWSRDGSKIAFVSTRDGNKEIYVMNADGTNQTRLTNDLGNDDSPYWSPDGSKIIFRSDRERDCCDPTSQVWVMNADGTSLANLSNNQSGDYSSSWASGTGNQPPVANAGGPYSGVPGQNTVFNGSGSFDSDGSVASYSWNFGDGGTSSVASPTHAYSSAGTYTVTLTVTDNLGAQGSATTTAAVSSSSSDGFVSNFLQWGLARQPSGAEGGYWDDILRAAYPQGQTSMLLAMREFGMTVFESAEYAARNRSDHWYVYDLYKTYLMRDPDSSGWAWWEAQVPSMGREQVRHAFDQSIEFNNIVATLTASGQPSSAVSSLATARVDPFNQTGDQIRARDCEWGLNLLSLPGRAGLDLGLGLSYSSLVWTRSGPYAYFDEDRGALGPGFRLGFATVQGPYFDAQAARNVYVVVTSSGEKVELRQIGTTSTYESGDSSHLQLIAGSNSLLLRTTDGTQMSYSPSVGQEWRTTGIEDRNGNVIAVSYAWWGDVQSVADTLGRTITFNYDANENLQSVTQNWTVGGQTQAHTWATFGWGTKVLQPGFSSVAAVGTYAGEAIPVLTQVGLDDGTRYNFEYTSAGQVNVIHRYSSDSVERSRTTYDYATLPDDCPRLINMQVSADSWTGVNGVPAAVVTQFTDLGNGSHEMTAPDGTTTDREVYGTGWQRGLVVEEDASSGGALQRQALTTWDQDNTSVNYQTNPRVKETNIYDFPTDAPSNRRRTTIDYGPYVQYGLPNVVTEYDSTGAVPVRQTFTDYNLAQGYLNQRIIGLVSSVQVYDNAAGKYLSKTTYAYDESGSVHQQAVTATAHDQSYDSSFLTRGDVTSVSRWDTTDINNTYKLLTSHVTYDAAGSVLTTTDPASHQTSASYADSFSDGNNTRNTFAYPTTVTDADGFSSTAQYNFDFSAKTRVQGPPPNNQPNGIIQTFAYDSAARIQQVTTTNTGAYTRYIYGPNYVVTYSTVNNVADEAYTCTVFDGVGRAVLAASNNPGVNNDYMAQATQLDAMGRAFKQSNPAEVDGGWNPTGDDSAGWLYTRQTYDWKGRPLVTTYTDGTQKTASYDGCGCAGDEVVTLTDEAGREQKVYSDSLGRQWKTEAYDWYGNVYSTTENILNALDQPAFVRQFQGNDQSGVYQETAIGYDGYGRLQSKHSPEQNAGTSTVYSYNPDGTLYSVTDARGVKTTFGYNARRLVTGITYDRQGVATVATDKNGTTPVADTAAVGFTYDAAGNRLTMTDGSGSTTYHYDSLSRLTSEDKQFAGLSGTYTLSYQYNLAGALKQVTDQAAGASFTYSLDNVGRVTAITGSGLGTSSPLASGMQYRAWGALKGMSYGNGMSVTFSYNSRGLVTHYGIGGVTQDGQYGAVAHGSDFDYYADGRVKYASDLFTDALIYDNYRLHDRAYSYDHVGRLQEAYSGSEANQFEYGTASGVEGAFRQSYSYDAFDNPTSRLGRFWTLPDNDTEAYATTGRNTAWEYDPDGRFVSRNETTQNGLTPYQPLRDSYDAAGRLVQETQTTSRPNPNPHINGVITTTTVQTETYDGAGLVAEEGSTTPTTFYLRSTILGGQVVSEYDPSGARRVTHVSAGGAVIADAWNRGGTPSVVWRHQNPVTGDELDTDSAGVVTSKATVDPAGVNLGDSDPTAGSSSGGSGSDGGMSQGQMDKMYAQLLPPWMGGDALQATVVEKPGSTQGFQINASAAFSMAAMGAGTIIFISDTAPNGTFITFENTRSTGERDSKTTRWAPLTAVGNWVGYLPEGTVFGNQDEDYYFSLDMSDIANPGSDSRNMSGVFSLSDLPGTLIGGGGFQGGPQNPIPLRGARQKSFERAFGVAINALNASADCRNAVMDATGQKLGENPAQVMQLMKDTGQFVYGGSLVQKNENGDIDVAYAENVDLKPDDPSSKAMVKLYAAFFDPSLLYFTALSVGRIASPGKSYSDMSIEQVQALILLHELRHRMTGKGHSSLAESRQWTKEIEEACLPRKTDQAK